MATKKKTTTKKKSSVKKKNPVKLRSAFDPTFRLTWKDNDGTERSLCIGMMHWCSIGYEDAIELEKLIGEVIVNYFNGQLKKTKAKKKNAK